MTKAERTRQNIIQSAEKLFAQKGFRAMTLRDVTQDAGVNLASVNYHFGSKSALMHAVMRKHIEPVNRERLIRLDHLIAEYFPAPIPLDKIFDALFRPLFEHAAQGNLPQLMSRVMTEPVDFMRNLHKEFFAELSQRFLVELKRCCPQLTEQERQYRFFLSVSTMIGTIIEQGRLENISSGKLHGQNTDIILTQLTAYVVAGFQQFEPSNQ